MYWERDTQVQQTVDKIAEAVKFRCVDASGVLDKEAWFKETLQTIEQEYIEMEERLSAEATKTYVFERQRKMLQSSRDRVHRRLTRPEKPTTYAQANTPSDGPALPPLPSLESIKGEFVSVPTSSNAKEAKLVLYCTGFDLDAVIDDYGRRERENNKRKKRYQTIRDHMKARDMRDAQTVIELYKAG